MQFSEKLKKLRAQKGVSQTQLANAIFVSRGAVAKWENGLGLPSEQSLSALADYFGIEPAELLSDPQTETVIVEKNSVLSKQKTWLTILASCMGFVIIISVILIAVLLKDSPEEPIITPTIISRELIFETEKDLQTDKFLNYPDSEISADKVFSDSRTFEIAKGTAIVTLPKLLIKLKTNIAVSYEDVTYDKLIITCSQENIFSRVTTDFDGNQDLDICAQDYYAPQFQGWVNIKYDDLSLSLKVYRNHVAVESVELLLKDHTTEIDLGESKFLSLDIHPYDASYKDCEISIKNIQRPNGLFYQGDLSQYAYLGNVTIRELYITAKIEIGSTIFLSATASYDNIESNELAVTVKRIAVESFRLIINDEYIVGKKGVTKGEITHLSLSVSPLNASFNLLNESATIQLLTPDIATLTPHEDSWTLTASSSPQAIGKTICFKITVEDKTETINWRINGIRAQSITLMNAATNRELEEITYMNKGDVLQLQAIVMPADADYEKISFNLFVDLSNFGRFVTVSDDGILTISENAPSGMVVYMNASIVRLSNDSYYFTVYSKSYRIIVN